jgi:hypothetical protein
MKDKMKKIILFGSPLILLFYVWVLGIIATLISLPSDMSVFIGIVLFCMLVWSIYHFFLFIKKTFNKKEKTK